MRAWIVPVAVLGIVALVAFSGTDEPASPPREPEETYRLVHATGNSESFVAKGLSRRECEARKKEYKATASALGVYNESLGIGSITCLPESLF